MNNASYDSDRAISANGLVLLFASIRYGGFGGPDLWVSTRQSIDAPGTPLNLGSAVNTAGLRRRSGAEQFQGGNEAAADELLAS